MKNRVDFDSIQKIYIAKDNLQLNKNLAKRI